MRIPVSVLPVQPEGAHEFNGLLSRIRDNKDMSTIKRSYSGGISVGNHGTRPPAYDIRSSRTCVELTVLAEEGMWRIQFRSRPQGDDGKEHRNYKEMNGHRAFALTKEILLKHGVNLDDYIIDNGEEVKKQIEPPPIKTFRGQLNINGPDDHGMECCHHIDRHQSYPAGLIQTHPEFEPAIRYIWEHRNGAEGGKYKKMLNYFVGYLQSIGCCGAKWAHLAKDAIHNNNDFVYGMAHRLQDAGYMPLLYNTDGIWYHSPDGSIYHGEGEGSDIGQWHNDVVNARLRIKSAGSYEYMLPDGSYHPVVRGFTRLDARRDRSTWTWGDIYKLDAEPMMFVWDGEQITDEEGNVY